MRTRFFAAALTVLAAITWSTTLVNAGSGDADNPVVQEGETGLAPVPQGIIKKAHKSELKTRHPLSPDAAALGKAKKAASDRLSKSPKNQYPKTAAATGSPRVATFSTATSSAPLSAVYNNANFQGIGAGCCTPSDSTGDIGPNHFVEMVNDAVAAYPRTGGMATSASLEAFDGFPYDCAFDPQIAYDKPAGRWLYSTAVLRPQSAGNCAGPFSSALLAFGWSKTADPSNLGYGWCRFYIGTGSNLADYDKLGHDNNFINIGANLFNRFGADDTSQFLTAKIWSIKKPAAGVTSCTLPATYSFGSPSAPMKHADGTRVFTPMPVNMTDSSGYGYVLDARELAAGPATKIGVWRIASSLGKPVLYRQGDVAVAAYDVPPPIPQPGGPGIPSPDCSQGNCLDSLDGRLTQAVGHYDPDIRLETLWTQHAIGDPAVGPRSVERWYELMPGQMRLHQWGDVGDASLHIFNGAVSPSMAGNEAAMFYNIGNENSGTSIAVQTRSPLTPLGQFQNQVFLQSGGTNYDASCGSSVSPPLPIPCRWGDYSSARPDPQSTNAVWGVNAYNPGFGTGGGAPEWGTTIAAVTPGCGTASVTGGLDHRNTYVFQASSDGCTSPQYEFWLRYPSGKWVLMQPFSPSAIFSWDSTGAPAASYSIHVWANQVGDSTASYEGVGELNFSLSAPVPCDSAAIGPLNPSQPAGSVFGFVASSTGCQAPMFQYWYQPPGGTWKIGRPFNEDPTWDWDTTGLKPGTYNVRVWANQQGDSTAAAEASADALATMIGCDGAAVTPDVASQPAGSPVSLSATSTGCPDPTYEFWTQMPTGTWVMLRGWGGPDFDWSTAGLAPGKYTFHVWSNEQGGNTGTYDVFGVSTITLTGCTSSSVTPASGSSHVGASVTFTANAVGCPTPVFEFWLQDTLGKWHRMTGFAGSTWTWNTTGWAKGTYHLHVWANQQDAYTGTYEVYAAATYTLT